MRRGSHTFYPRKCWLCGNTISTREEGDFFIPGDYTGVCKDHHLKDILSVKGTNTDSPTMKKLSLLKGITYSTPKIESIKLKDKIIIKNKIPNKMRKFLINLFIFVVALEIIIHLPHILNVLINKIK
jgi:hypothetical protein